MLGAACDCPDTAILLTSELVTNAVQAARLSEHEPAGRRVAPEPIHLTLRALPGGVVIEVFDSEPGPPIPRQADPNAEHGRGLVLVKALSKEWGFDYPKSGGKVVYAVVSGSVLPAPAPPQAAASAGFRLNQPGSLGRAAVYDDGD
jgi:hypothetical protein